MPIIPISLKLDSGRRALVVGGGQVALRKVAWLAGCGVAVDVIAPEVEDAIAGLARETPVPVMVFQEPYRPRDLEAYGVVIAAADDETVNACVAADARRAGVPVNVVDRPELCTFFVPATVRRGDLQIAVGTGGVCPSLAARLRQDIEAQLPPWYGDLAAALGAVRRESIGTLTEAEERRALMAFLASREIAEKLKYFDLEAMKSELRRHAAAWLQRHRQTS